MKNACRTYFYIVGSARASEIAKELDIPMDTIKVSTLGDTTSMRIGFNDTYDVNVNNMFRSTLKDLLGKEERLAELKSELGLDYYLVAVPEIASKGDEVHQILSLDADIVEFLYLSKATHDLDYYIF